MLVTTTTLVHNSRCKIPRRRHQNAWAMSQPNPALSMVEDGRAIAFLCFGERGMYIDEIYIAATFQKAEAVNAPLYTPLWHRTNVG